MKEYNSFFETNDGYAISISSSNDSIVLGIDIGVDGFFTNLNKKEVDLLINSLKEARKKIHN